MIEVAGVVHIAGAELRRERALGAGVRVRHRILKVAFHLVNVAAVEKVADFVWPLFDRVGIIGQRLIVVAHLHFDVGPPFVSRGVVRHNFYGFIEILEGQRKILLGHVGHGSLL